MFSRDLSSSYPASWDPWREFERLQGELNRLFTGTRESMSSDYPRLNVYTHETGATVTALLPGSNPDNLDVSVLGESLTIRGKIKEEPVNDGSSYHRRERYNGQFSRTITLPFRIDANSVNAKYKNGVLEVELMRSEEERPKRVAISGK